MFPNYEHFRQVIARTEGDLTKLKGKYSKPVRVAILQFITGKKYKRNEATFNELLHQLMIYTECNYDLSPEEIDRHIYQRVLNYNAREIGMPYGLKGRANDLVEPILVKDKPKSKYHK